MKTKWNDPTSNPGIASMDGLVQKGQDPFWDRLCAGTIRPFEFEQELLKHLEISDHPKGKVLVKLAVEKSEDLQDAYLEALDLLELLE